MNQIVSTTEANNTLLQEVILRMTNLIKIERIYHIKEQEGASVSNLLVILISNKTSEVVPEICPIINTILFSYPNFRYRLFFAHQAKDHIKRGNLFLYDSCSARNLVYSDPESDFKLYPESMNIKTMFEKAKLRFQKEMLKVQSFREGADFYVERENYAHAAFMVHQHIELVFRAIEQFAMGKEKVTHSIKAHQRNVVPYLADMASLFDEHNEDELKLVDRLDDAYLAVRYENSYKIDKEKLLLAQDKGMLAQQMAETHYMKMIAEFEAKHLGEKIHPESDGIARNNEGIVELKLTQDVMDQFNWQYADMDCHDLESPVSGMASFFTNYPLKETKAKLWELYKGWVESATILPDGNELKDMLYFYDQLVDMLNVSCVYTQINRNDKALSE